MASVGLESCMLPSMRRPEPGAWGLFEAVPAPGAATLPCVWLRVAPDWEIILGCLSSAGGFRSDSRLCCASFIALCERDRERRLGCEPRLEDSCCLPLPSPGRIEVILEGVLLEFQARIGGSKGHPPGAAL